MSRETQERQEVAQAVALFDAVYAPAPIAACLVDGSGVVLRSNDALVHVLGDGAPPWRERHLSDLIETESAFQTAFARVLDAAKAGKRGETVLHAQLVKAAPVVALDLHFMHLGDKDAARHSFLAHVVPALPQKRLATGKLPGEGAAVAAAAAGGVTLWQFDPETGETWCSDTLLHLLGHVPGPAVISFAALRTLMHPADRAAADSALQRLKTQGGERLMHDFRLRDARGTWRWFAAAGAAVVPDAGGTHRVLAGTITEVTSRKIAETRLAAAASAAQEHRSRLDQLAENAQVGLFEFRLHPDGTVAFAYVSDGLLDLIGVSRADVDADGSACFRNISPEYLDSVHAEIDRSRRELSPLRFRYRLAHPERGDVWIGLNSHPSRLADGTTTWHGSAYDVTPEVEREAEVQAARDQALVMKAQMEQLALHDGLTGLPNRRYFDRYLAELGASVARRPGATEVTLIRVDLDHFKYINDNLGHAAGDAVLHHVARILSEGVSDVDFVARVGGDEFTIVLGGGGDTALARERIADMQVALASPFHFADRVCRVGASFGIATCDPVTIAAGEIHAFADAALYEAKRKGRNRVEAFTDQLHERMNENRQLARDIDGALENGEFEPLFQPQICARSRRLVGLEVLARWQHPARGLLAPAQFLGVAEQSRLVPMIDRQILEKTRGILSGWRRSGFVPPKVSFNVSSGRLRDVEILQAARQIRDDGTLVAFELLESILVEDDTAEFRFNLDALKDSGIQIEIDDFGSGKASILAVMEAEPAVVKIDRRLTRNIAENMKARELLAAIVRISGALGIATTVEGVETREQASILTDLGCDVLQGFLFARPLDAMQMLSFAQCQQNDSA